MRRKFQITRPDVPSRIIGERMIENNQEYWFFGGDIVNFC
jgi:hypothetical protein